MTRILKILSLYWFGESLTSIFRYIYTLRLQAKKMHHKQYFICKIYTNHKHMTITFISIAAKIKQNKKKNWKQFTLCFSTRCNLSKYNSAYKMLQFLKLIITFFLPNVVSLLVYIIIYVMYLLYYVNMNCIVFFWAAFL